MNLYNLLYILWHRQRELNLSTTEIALFFFIVNKGNLKHWEFPVGITTKEICNTLHITEHTVAIARKHLAEAGLITFETGRNAFLPPRYSLTMQTDNDMRPAAMAPKPQRTDTGDGISQATITIADAEAALLADDRWHLDVTNLMSQQGMTPSSVISLIRQFIATLRCRGITRVRPDDIRSHFFNWMRIEISRHNEPRTSTSKNHGTTFTKNALQQIDISNNTIQSYFE